MAKVSSIYLALIDWHLGF